MFEVERVVEVTITDLPKTEPTYRTYYHAGLSKIEKFKVNYGGLHMGGQASALECALRKAYDLHMQEKLNTKIYMHYVNLNDSGLVETVDHGSGLMWDHFGKCGIDGAIYKNEFEPDIRKSVVLYKTDRILGIKTIKAYSIDEAEDLLQKLQNYSTGKLFA